MKLRLFIKWVFFNLLGYTLCVPILFLGSLMTVFPINSVGPGNSHEVFQTVAELVLPVILWSVLLSLLQWVVLKKGMILFPYWLLSAIVSWLSVMVIVQYCTLNIFNNLNLTPLLEGGLIGLIPGTIVGITQTIVIRKPLQVTIRWFLANSISFSVVCAISAIILAAIPYGEGPGEGILLGLVIWSLPALIGLFVGVGTGIVLPFVLSEA
jgi:hypothetical protein